MAMRAFHRFATNVGPTIRVGGLNSAVGRDHLVALHFLDQLSDERFAS